MGKLPPLVPTEASLLSCLKTLGGSATSRFRCQMYYPLMLSYKVKLLSVGTMCLLMMESYDCLFQGGAFLEVLNVQGKDLTSKCKMLGSSINDGCREFDKSIKSYVLLLEGESTRTKVVIPKDTKQGLCILQSFLVLQLWVPAGLSFSVEVAISDSSNQKRRMLLSTSYKDISVTSFHVKIPLTTVKRELWLNFCLDLKSIVQDCFSGQDFRTIDSIIICANCKLRRVFTLRCQPKDDFANEVVMVENLYEDIPKSLQIVATSNVQFGTQV